MKKMFSRMTVDSLIHVYWPRKGKKRLAVLEQTCAFVFHRTNLRCFKTKLMRLNDDSHCHGELSL